jgi:heptosyltransferase-3
MSAAASAEFGRILVVATRQIGDVLLTTPLIAAARRRWPAAQIDVLGFAGTLALLHGNADVHRTIEMRPGSGWLRLLPLIARLWRRYDLALVTDPGDRAHLAGWIAARVRSGIVFDRAAAWKKRLLQHVVVMTDPSTHVVVEKGQLLAPWSAPSAPWSVTPPKGAPLPADLETLLERRFVVVQVPSMWSYKQWPLAHYRTLVAALVDTGLQVVVSGGPSPADRAKSAEVSAVAPPPKLIDASGRLDLAQLATLLRRASLYVGPDTSVTHLAAACGAPCVALFGPTSPQRWGPWPHGSDAPIDPRAEPGWALRNERQQVGKVILLQGPGACVPCGKAGCENHNESRSECLEALDPGRVLRECRALLALPADRGDVSVGRAGSRAAAS